MSSRTQAVPDWKPDPKDVTGTHDFALIKAEFEKLQDEREEEEKRKYEAETWWKRQRWLWAIAFIFIFVNVFLGVATSVIITRFSQPVAAPAAK